jgi:hypothetical protein
MPFNGQDNTAFIVIKGSGEVRRSQASLQKTQLLKISYTVGQKK